MLPETKRLIAIILLIVLGVWMWFRMSEGFHGYGYGYPYGYNWGLPSWSLSGMPWWRRNQYRHHRFYGSRWWPAWY